MTQRRSVIRHTTQLLSVSNNTTAINECVRYILYREGSKIPIKRADIANHLSNACEVQKSEITGVIAGAESVLNKVYGYNLVKHNAKSGPQYIVTLKEPCEDSLQSALEEETECILLNAALAHIFMSGGSVKDEELWKFLIKAGLMKQDDSTATKMFTKTFISQSYITCIKNDGDNPITTFEWGPRAHAEASKMFILQKVAQALGKEPDFWREQYKNASTNSDPATTTNHKQYHKQT